MKNTKKQLYFESLESTIYQWFGRTVRKHNSKYYCEKYNNHQRQVSRVTANLSEVLCRSDFRTIYYFQSLISTLQSLLGLCLGLGLCLQATSRAKYSRWEVRISLLARCPHPLSWQLDWNNHIITLYIVRLSNTFCVLLCVWV